MRGEGNIAKMVAQQYAAYGKLYKMNEEYTGLDLSGFKKPGQQGVLF